jgi:hypothetical protein
MQALQPLAVQNVGLGAGAAVRELARLDQVDFEAAAFEQLKEWNPVNTGRFHSDGAHPASLEPVGNSGQVAGVGTEGADRLRIAVGGDADVMDVGMYVNAAAFGFRTVRAGEGLLFLTRTPLAEVFLH